MIKVTVRYGENHTDIRFPCTENELQEAVERLHPSDPTNMELYVSAVHYPEELAVLQYCFVNLDELNYLGKRMESFWGDEAPRFGQAIKLEGASTVREMINLSFNLDKYALITDLSDMGKVSREYVLQTEGSVHANDADDPKYVKIGMELFQSGRGILTEQGLLFPDKSRPLEQPYTGTTFPEYLYSPCMLVAEISYRGQREYAYLPTERLAIQKALGRLGAASLHACEVRIDSFDMSNPQFAEFCNHVLAAEGLPSLNHLCEIISNQVSAENFPSFYGAFAASGVDNTADAIRIAENVDSFYYAKGVKNEAELGKWWLEHYSQFSVSPELEQFFDYQAYGEYLSQFLDIHYLESGDCVFLDGTTMDDVLGIAPAEDMRMGGM
ncbi:MAG: antirestriction protein ArdA [Faecousia sp.]